jgi:hypothetical protein
MRQRLRLEIKKQTQPEICTFTNNIYDIIRTDLQSMDASGKKLDLLSTIYNALMSVPPTSVEAERAFSAAGLFVTKLRNRMSDESLSKVAMIRNFLKNKKKDE